MFFYKWKLEELNFVYEFFFYYLKLIDLYLPSVAVIEPIKNCANSMRVVVSTVLLQSIKHLQNRNAETDSKSNFVPTLI